MGNQSLIPIGLTKDLIVVTKRLADAVEFDVNGCLGQGGNGGLVSDKAIRAAGEEKRMLSRVATYYKSSVEIVRTADM